jgi:hypothetical protein
MYNQLNVLYHYELMLIQLFYVQNQIYLIDFDEQEEAKQQEIIRIENRT